MKTESELYLENLIIYIDTHIKNDAVISGLYRYSHLLQTEHCAEIKHLKKRIDELERPIFNARDFSDQ